LTTTSTGALTICTVSFGSERFVRRNIDLTTALNPAARARWIVVENGPDALPEYRGRDGVQIIRGCPPDPVHDERSRGSYHHADGLRLALEHAETRFVLILDPDFYIVRPGWIDDVLGHMDANRLAFFGVPWHPSWFTKYRYFPCAHCVFIDTHRVPGELLDFTPEIVPKTRGKHPDDAAPGGPRKSRLERRLKQRVRRTRIMRALGRRRSVGGSHDTGYRLYRGAIQQRDLRFEAALPVYDPRRDPIQGGAPLAPRDRLLDLVLPDARRLTPRRRSSYTTSGFASFGVPDVRANGWEEFIWQGAPFGFHLRWHRRGAADRAEAKAVLPEILDRFTSPRRVKIRP
jgi:hypothetical protein